MEEEPQKEAFGLGRVVEEEEDEEEEEEEEEEEVVVVREEERGRVQASSVSDMEVEVEGEPIVITVSSADVMEKGEEGRRGTVREVVREVAREEQREVEESLMEVEASATHGKARQCTSFTCHSVWLLPGVTG